VPARGVPRLRGTGRGDLVVHLEVRTPTKLDGRQEELLRELARLRDEERTHGPVSTQVSNLFTRLRDAFK
jgi:molecular chaperone DnaJ